MRSFSDQQVRAAITTAGMLPVESAGKDVRRSATKHVAKLQSEALRDDTCDVARAGSGGTAPVDSLDPNRTALFWRGAAEKDGTYPVVMADGRGGVVRMRARDHGDKTPRHGLMRPKTCVVLSAAQAAKSDGVDTDAAALLGELTENAIAAASLGGRQPSRAGRLEWVYEAVRMTLRLVAL